MFAWFDLLGVPEDKYSLSLRPTLWLGDVSLVLLSTTVGLKITITISYGVRGEEGERFIKFS